MVGQCVTLVGVVAVAISLGMGGPAVGEAATPSESPTRIESETLIIQHNPDAWAKDSVRVSPDGKRFAVIIQAEDRKLRASIDGRDERSYAWVRDITFSGDSRHVAYVATIDGQDLPVLDGQEGAFRGEIWGGTRHPGGTLRLNVDGSRLAFVARKGNTPAFGVVADGAMGRPNVDPNDGPPMFSPDGKRLAYIGQDGAERFVALDGKPGARYPTVYKGTLTFSPDSKRFAYIAAKGGKWTVVVDGVEGTLYSDVIVTTLRFSPDGAKVAHAAQTDSGKWAVAVNDKVGRAYDYIGPFTGLNWSPDGKRLAYAAQVGKQWAVVLDGEEKLYDEVAWIVFSPDSKRVAFAARTGDKWVAVADSRDAGTYESILNETITFTPDSKHLVYGALTDGRPHMVVDGRPAASFYQAIWNIYGGHVVFDTPASFSYIGQRDTSIYLVREALVHLP